MKVKRSVLPQNLPYSITRFLEPDDTKHMEFQVTLGDRVMIYAFLTHLSAKGSAQKTFEAYFYHLKSFINYKNQLKPRPSLDTITEQMLQDYIFRESSRILVFKTKSKPFSKVTLNGKIKHLKSFYNYLDKKQLLNNGNPSKGLEYIKVPFFVRQVLRPPDIKKLLTLCKKNWFGERSKAIIVTLFGTGIRSGELRGLKIPDIDWENNLMTVMGKGSKQRQIPLLKEVQAAIKHWIKVRKDNKSEYLFCNHNNDRPLHQKPLEHQLESLGLKLGLKTNPHIFRHSCATYLLAKGFPLAYLQRLLGHSSIMITQQYLHSSVEDIQGSLDSINPLDFLKK